MPDNAAVLVGLMAGAVGVLVAFLPVRRWLGPVEATALAVAFFGWREDFTSVELGQAIVLVVVGARLPERMWPLRIGAVLWAAQIVGNQVPLWVDDRIPWVAASGVVAVAVLGRLGRSTFGEAPTLLLMTWVPLAAYLATPDTEEVTVVGVAFAVACAVVIVRRISVAPGATDALAVAMVWAIVIGGRERWPSYVVISAGALLVYAAVLFMAGRRLRWETPAGVAFIALHLVTGVVAARWAALGKSWSVNWVRAAIVVAVAVAVAAPLVWRATRPRPVHA